MTQSPQVETSSFRTHGKKYGIDQYGSNAGHEIDLSWLRTDAGTYGRAMIALTNKC